MRTYTFSLFVLILIGLSSCKSSFTKEDRSNLILLQQKLENKPFEFIADAAIPFQTQALNSVANDLLIRTGNSTARINIQGDNYTMKVVDSNVQFALPFYGERRFSGGYNDNNAGFDFKSSISDKTNALNENKKYLSFNFKTKNDLEILDIEVQIFNINNVRLYITSSHRTFMKYDGYLKWVEIE